MLNWKRLSGTDLGGAWPDDDRICVVKRGGAPFMAIPKRLRPVGSNKDAIQWNIFSAYLKAPQWVMGEHEDEWAYLDEAAPHKHTPP